jgi:hypothetical protein
VATLQWRKKKSTNAALGSQYLDSFLSSAVDTPGKASQVCLKGLHVITFAFTSSPVSVFRGHEDRDEILANLQAACQLNGKLSHTLALPTTCMYFECLNTMHE